MNSKQEIVKIENLSVRFTSRKGPVDAIRDISFSIGRGESFALIGESGSGKSTVAFALLNYIASNGSITSGQVLFHGENLLDKSHEELNAFRGKKISMVFQDPHTSLNPSYTIGDQLTETICKHEGVGAKQAWSKAADLLEAVQLPDPDRLLRQYPHQISGGQKQRVVIAQALSCRPELLILDEPTTALDVTTELRFLELLADLRKQYDTAFLYITHDLGIVARIADRIGVIYAGQLVEQGSREDIFLRSTHPYTRALLKSIPDIRAAQRRRLQALPGLMPDLTKLPKGCIFKPRCSFAGTQCEQDALALRQTADGHQTACLRWRDLPPMGIDSAEEEPKADKAVPDDSKADLIVDQVKSYYTFRPSLIARLAGRKEQTVKAVDGLSFDIHQGETFGLVGESGCGKSTIGRSIVRLKDITAGRVSFFGRDLNSYSTRDMDFRKRLQIIFQNPDSSLNPKHKVKTIIGRPLKLFGLANTAKEVRQKSLELLDMVRLGSDYLHRFPHEMSGGEKQRVAIARAFASRPSFIVCDEVTSALDVSVQASVVNLLMDLQNEFNASYLFISHDLSIVRQLSNRIAVMYLGVFVEVGTSEQVFNPPYHPYTKALLSAVSVPSLNQTSGEPKLEGGIPSAANPPSGCFFHPRCSRCLGEICSQTLPPLKEIGRDHYLACHLSAEELASDTGVFA